MERTVKLVVAIALIVCVQGAGFAQGSLKLREFGGVSVKQAAPASSQGTGEMKSTDEGSVNVTADRASYEGVTLKRLLMVAYDLNSSQISGPDWIETQRYDVSATIPAGTPKDEIPAMLQRLLGDRFEISQHTEKKDEPIYLLHIGPTGPKLRPSSSVHPQSLGFVVNQADQTQFKVTGMTMAEFADALSGQLDRPVTDETKLPGKFDISLPVDSQNMQAGSKALSTSLSTAVQGIGLKLDPGKTSVKHLVVDKAEKTPAEN